MTKEEMDELRYLLILSKMKSNLALLPKKIKKTITLQKKVK